MPKTEPQPVAASNSRVELIDVVALVVGYGLAAVLFRAFWPKSGVTVGVGLFAIGFYTWLGMAMSGPLLLIRQRRQPTRTANKQKTAEPGEPPIRTWAEKAWLVIGVYWIVMGVFVLPVRMHVFRLTDMVLFGIVPVAGGLLFRVFTQETAHPGDVQPWTHRAALALLWTWPVAWLCLIVIGEAIL
jgi:hypothetical protein